MSNAQSSRELNNIETLIAEVDASDLAQARDLIAKGVQTLQKQWIPTHLIVSALALELQDQIAGEVPSPELTVYLRRLADFVSYESELIEKH